LAVVADLTSVGISIFTKPAGISHSKGQRVLELPHAPLHYIHMQGTARWKFSKSKLCVVH
jgi:hypothetical protein